MTVERAMLACLLLSTLSLCMCCSGGGCNG